MEAKTSEVQKYADTRDRFQHLTDEEFVQLAGTNLATEHLVPLLQDAMGLNGAEARGAVFPLVATAEDIAKSIVSDLTNLQQKILEQ